MVKYISKPNYMVSVLGKMIKFNALGIAMVNKPEVMAVLDTLSHVKKDAPKAKVTPKKVEEKPAPKSKKKKK